jgi:hypothetical protein
MRIVAEPGRRPRLAPAEGRVEAVRALRESALGPRLAEIVLRAGSASHARQRAVAEAGARRAAAAGEAEVTA